MINNRFVKQLSHRQDGQREHEANSEAVVVDWILPRLHGVVLEAH